MRADAQQNYDRILTAAEQVFAREGTDASLSAVAEAAGVGIGTLYRRFPTREALIETVYRSRVAEICDTARDLVESSVDPSSALKRWMVSFAELLVDKRGMTQAIKPVLSDETDFRIETRKRLTDAVDLLMQSGVEDGTLRGDVHPLDILRSLGGIAFVSEDSDQVTRLIDLLLDGLRHRTRGI